MDRYVLSISVGFWRDTDTEARDLENRVRDLLRELAPDASVEVRCLRRIEVPLRRAA